MAAQTQAPRFGPGLWLSRSGRPQGPLEGRPTRQAWGGPSTVRG